MPGGAQVQYEAFPYPVQIQSGEIRVLPGKIHIDVTGQLANNGSLVLTGDVIEDGEEQEIELSATWTGLRLDETRPQRWTLAASGVAFSEPANHPAQFPGRVFVQSDL